MKGFVQLATVLTIISAPLFTESAHAQTLCVIKGGLIKAVVSPKCPQNTKPLSISIRGPKGDIGEAGATGPQGSPGERGEKGEAGIAGLQGIQGDKGDTGDVGPQGPQGDKGDTGDVGPQGPQGDKGDTGDVGPQGPQGDKGDTGDVGPQGDKGDAGPAGTAANFTNDILMTCKQYSFKSTLKGSGSTTDKGGRTTRKVTARCGSNQWLVSHAETLQTSSANSQVVASLTMRDIVTQPSTNTSDFTTAADGSAAIPSGVAVEFSDTASANTLSTRLICCTLDANTPEGKPTIE